MKHTKTTIQTTLVDNEKDSSYYGINAWGETILIPNFQPLTYDDNPRLDVENKKTKRKKEGANNEK